MVGSETDGPPSHVVHFDILLGPDRMAHGPRILAELLVAHEFDVVDALDRRVGQVGRESLVAVNGEALLQRELEPVLAEVKVTISKSK